MKMRKVLYFGFAIMALILAPVLVLTPWGDVFDAHLTKDEMGVLGLLMLALVVVAIMLGFPTAFTLMGMGVFFAWLAYRSSNPELATRQVLDLMVQRTAYQCLLTVAWHHLSFSRVVILQDLTSFRFFRKGIFLKPSENAWGFSKPTSAVLL